MIPYIQHVPNIKRERNLFLGFVLMVATAILFFAVDSNAREIDFGKARVNVAISFGVESIFRFSSEVRTVTEANRFEIRPADGENPDYSILLVKPRMSEGTSSVTFILADGTVVRTLLSITKDQRLDTIVDFRQIEELSQTTLDDPALKQERSELGLLKAMIRGDQVTDFKVRPYQQAIDLGSKNIMAELVRVFEGPSFNGYVYRIRTNSSKTYKFDLSALEIGRPNLAIASFVEANLIGGKTEEERETFLYVVAKQGASKRRHVLPTEISSSEKTGGNK